jgi:hypothetical protein
MNNWTGIWQQCGGAIVLMALAALPVDAQVIQPWEDRGFVNVSGGVQPTGRTHVAAGEFDLYDETGSFDATLKTASAGIFDIQAGVRVWDNALVAVSYTRYSDKVGALVNARVPDPLLVDAFADASTNVGGLHHREQSVHMSVGYMVPIVGLPGLRLMFHAGPTVFSLDKDVVTGVTVPAETQTVDGAVTQNVSGTALGAHFGADVQYMVTDRFGGGVLLRWASGKVDVPQIDGGKVSVGGLTVGVGLRYSF